MASSPNAFRLDAYKRFYPQLLEVLPISHLISNFFALRLLSNDHKNKLDSMPEAEDKSKVEYFLTKIISPGLQIGCNEQFEEMLKIMLNSDDPPVKYLAGEVTKFMHAAQLSAEKNNSGSGMS